MARIVEGAAAAISQTGPRKIASEIAQRGPPPDEWLAELVGAQHDGPGGLIPADLIGRSRQGKARAVAIR
jgi:hypothetical protein